jgi:hypothetical protein
LLSLRALFGVDRDTPDPDLREKIVLEDPQPLSRLHPGLAPDLEAIVHKCLEKNPERRYTSARQLAQDLQRFLSDQPVHARRVGYLVRVWRRAWRRPAYTLVSGLVVLVLVLGGITVELALLRMEEQRHVLAPRPVPEKEETKNEETKKEETKNEETKKEETKKEPPGGEKPTPLPPRDRDDWLRPLVPGPGGAVPDPPKNVPEPLPAGHLRLLEHAREYFTAREWRKAQSEFEPLITDVVTLGRLSDEATYRVLLGHCLAEQAQWRPCRDQFDKARKLQSKEWTYIGFHALAAFRSDDMMVYFQGCQDLAHHIRLETVGDWLFLLALDAEFARRESQKANECFKHAEARAKGNDSVPARLFLAVMAHQQKHALQADKYLAAACKEMRSRTAIKQLKNDQPPPSWHEVALWDRLRQQAELHMKGENLP